MLGKIWFDVNNECTFFFSTVINSTAIFWPEQEDFVQEIKTKFPNFRFAQMTIEQLRGTVDQILIGTPGATEELSIIGELNVTLEWLPSKSIRRISALKVKKGGFFDYRNELQSINLDHLLAPNSRFMIVRHGSIAQ